MTATTKPRWQWEPDFSLPLTEQGGGRYLSEGEALTLANDGLYPEWVQRLEMGLDRIASALATGEEGVSVPAMTVGHVGALTLLASSIDNDAASLTAAARKIRSMAVDLYADSRNGGRDG